MGALYSAPNPQGALLPLPDAAAGEAPTVFGLKGRVGRGRANDFPDVKAAKQALSLAGYYPGVFAREADGHVDPQMRSAILGFQSDRGLRVDGWMGPGGQTERELERTIRPKVLAQKVKETPAKEATPARSDVESGKPDPKPDTPDGGSDKGQAKTPGTADTGGPMDISPERADRARERLGGISAVGASRLTDKDARDVLNVLAREPELLAKHGDKLPGLYQAAKDDTQFIEADKKRRLALSRDIEGDPGLKERFLGWVDLKDPQRRDAMRALMDKTFTAYGIKDKPPKVVFETLAEKGIGAKFDPRSDTITVNTNSHIYKNGGSFEVSVARTAMHEAVHAYQTRLASAVREGRIGSDHPDFRQGQLFLLNKVQDMTIRPDLDTHKDVEAYRNQPVERHAKKVTEELGKLIPVRY